MSFADILKVSKKGLSGSISNVQTMVRGRMPNMLSWGSLYLDFMFNGGLPWGKAYQLYGPSGAGKSTMTYRAIQANQKVAKELIKVDMGSLPNFLPHKDFGPILSRPVIICDAEGGCNEEFLGGCGVDYNDPNFAIFTPENGEDWFTYQKRVCMAYAAENDETPKDAMERKFKADYVPPITLIDSLAALIPKSMLEDEQRQIAYLARLLSDYLPLNTCVNSNSKATSFWINQVRLDPMAMMGNPERKKGGAAPDFFSSANFRVSRQGQNEDMMDSFSDSSVRGYELTLSPKKCRWAPVTGDKFEILTFMGRGYSRMNDMWRYGLASGQIKQNGAWYQLEVIGRPELNVKVNRRADDLRRYLRENNLWEIFVMQVFNGSAWGQELTASQLEMLGAIKTSDQPDIVSPEEELLLAEATEQLKAQQTTVLAMPGMPEAEV